MTNNNPAEYLGKLSKQLGIDLCDQKLAEYLDGQCPLAQMRSEFHIPLVRDIAAKTHDPDAGIDKNTAHTENQQNFKPSEYLNSDDECVYLCGNSLGLEPNCTTELINQELQVWSQS
jgi:kynureninase